MIIDSLTHVTPDGRWFKTQHDASLKRLLLEMDDAGVDKAVVVALDGYIENTFVAKVCAQHSDRLIPGASLNPAECSSAEDARVKTRNLLSNGDFSVLKLHPRLNGYDPLDSRCLAVLEEVACQDRPIPIWLDSVFRGARCTLRKPPMDIIHELAVRFDKIDFVLLHGAGSELMQLAEMCGVLHNITIDLSLTLLYYQPSSVDLDLRYVLSHRNRKTIAGSDFPEYMPSQYMSRVRKLATSAGCTEDKIGDVIGQNLERILHL